LPGVSPPASNLCTLTKNLTAHLTHRGCAVLPKTFSENEIITVYTENASDTEKESDNVITNTKTISVGDRVEIVYYQHNSDLKDKKIFSADISRTQE
jgi:hypothetical protein